MVGPLRRREWLPGSLGSLARRRVGLVDDPDPRRDVDAGPSHRRRQKRILEERLGTGRRTAGNGRGRPGADGGARWERGSGGRTRTCDQAVNSRPLYRLSYAGAPIARSRRGWLAGGRPGEDSTRSGGTAGVSGAPPSRSGQPTARRTRARIRSSTSGVSALTAKLVGHIGPSSRAAESVKPRVA